MTSVAFDVSGEDYAQHWAEKLGLTAVILPKIQGRFKPDIAVDDEKVDLGEVKV